MADIFKTPPALDQHRSYEFEDINETDEDEGRNKKVVSNVWEQIDRVNTTSFKLANQ